MKKFVPTRFKVPERLKTDKFLLRMLTINDVVKDYDAVMTSIDHLQGIFGPKSKWPFEKVAYPGRTISWKEWAKIRKR